MNRLLYIVMLFSILTSCSKDNVKIDNENPYSQKRPTKIIATEDSDGGIYTVNIDLIYEGDKLKQMKLIEMKSGSSNLYYTYNFSYRLDTVIIESIDNNGDRDEQKILIEKNKMSIWSGDQLTDMYLLKNGLIEESILHFGTVAKYTTRFFYTGNNLIKKIWRDIDEDGIEVRSEETSYKYEGDLVIRHKGGFAPETDTIKIKDGKLVSWSNGYYYGTYSYTPDGLISEWRDENNLNRTAKYYYENGRAEINFLKFVDEAIFDPLFGFFYLD